MNLIQLVLKQMRQRALSTWLTFVSVMLGVAVGFGVGVGGILPNKQANIVSANGNRNKRTCPRFILFILWMLWSELASILPQNVRVRRGQTWATSRSSEARSVLEDGKAIR